MDEPLRIDDFGDLGDLRSTGAYKRVLSWSSKITNSELFNTNRKMTGRRLTHDRWRSSGHGLVKVCQMATTGANGRGGGEFPNYTYICRQKSS
jgi:hypothetical protein